MRKTKSVYVLGIGIGALLAGAIACSAGGQTPSGGGAATEEPTTPAQNNQASSGTMPTIDPCSILTQDDAAAFFGVASGAGDPSVGSTTAECDYRSTDNADGLSLILQYAPGGALNSDAFTYMTKDGQSVPGLGDGAFWVAAGQLDVAKGDWIVTLNGAIGGTNAGVDKLTPIAQTAVGRLP
jgi:hypothetical protein